MPPTLDTLALARSYADIGNELHRAAVCFSEGARLLTEGKPGAEASIRRGLDLLGEVVEDMPRIEDSEVIAA